MTIFISYARKDAAAVATLRADLERAKRAVWLDAELTGGQAWWDTILAAIRDADVFLIALSHDWLRSRACKSEYGYALGCGRRVLAVKVDDLRAELAPPDIANSQIIDYRERTADSAIALVTAIATLPPAPPLPNPLPIPPPVPISYLSTYREQVESPSLTFEQQHQLLFALQGELTDEDDDHRDTIVTLLRQLRKRRDVVEAIGRDIDRLLAGTTGSSAVGGAGARVGTTAGAGTAAGATSSATSRVAGNAPPAAWFADPLRRFEQRYWDGNAWTAHVASHGRTSIDPNGITAGPRADDRPRVTGADAGAGAPAAVPAVGPFSPGGFAALVVASLFCFGIAGLVVGLVNLKHPARRGQSITLIVVGVAVLVVFGLAAMANSGSTS
jgi:TIR domain/Protein of unknown function (DUF2510)